MVKIKIHSTFFPLYGQKKKLKENSCASSIPEATKLFSWITHLNSPPTSQLKGSAQELTTCFTSCLQVCNFQLPHTFMLKTICQTLQFYTLRKKVHLPNLKNSCMSLYSLQCLFASANSRTARNTDHNIVERAGMGSVPFTKSSCKTKGSLGGERICSACN